MLSGDIPFAVSPTIVWEYEDVLKRPGLLGKTSWIQFTQIGGILDAICARGKLVEPWFRFRPFLDDPRTMPISTAPWPAALRQSCRETNIFGIRV